MIEIFISNQRVYAGSEIDLGINKKIYDLFEPDKRASDQTLTVDLVGNKENDQLFRGLFDVNVFVGTNSPTFDPSKRASAIIYADTIEQLRGFVQLTDVVVNYQNQVIYKIVFYGQNSDLFKKLSDKRLNELDLSEYDHEWNYDNITNSWATSVIQNGSPVSFELGKGYFYPMEYTSRDGQKERPDNWYVRYWRPWIYYKTILDRIVLEAGFDYNSTFLNSERFKRLIYNGDVVNERTDSEMEATLVEVGRTTTFDVTANFTDIPFNDTITDPLTQWNVDRFEPDNSAYYKFTGGIPLRVEKTSGADLVFAELNVDVVLELVIFDTNTNTDIKIYPFSQRVKTTQSPFQVGDFLNFYLDFTIDTASDNIRLDSTKDIAFVRVRSARYAGQSAATQRSIFSDSKVEIQSTAFFSAIISPTIEAGDTLTLNKYLGELTQKDWLMGVTKMFNLYFDPQPDGSLLIEPRDDGFFTNQLIDLTKQLDVSKDFTIKPLEQSKYRQYKYTYTQGKDSLNQSYEDGWGEVYGALTYQPENEFAKETKEVKLPFSLPIQARSPIAPSVKSPRVIPSFLNPQNEERYKPTGVPRVLIVDGLRGTLQSWTFENIVWNFYPYAGQMDSLDTPTIDLAFGEPNSIYWLREGRNDVAYPENISLFWQYHYQELTQLTSKNSKIVECYIKITPSLYSQMTFRKLYFINNAYYRLYEIEDYSPLNEDTTKCVFLKLDTIPALPITNRNIYGGGGVSDIGDTFVGDRFADRVIASGNSVQSADGAVVLGTNNSVSNGLKSIIIGGDTNQVTTSDALVWGLNNQLVDQSGVHLGYNIIETDTNYTMTGSEGAPLAIVVDTASGTKIVKLKDTPENRGKVIWVSKVSSSHKIDVVDWNDILIEEINQEETKTYILL